MGSIIEQIARTLATMPSQLEPCYQKHISDGTRPSLNKLETIFQDMCTHGSSVYIVIDALDEYHDSATFIEVLARLQHLSVHLLIASRPSVNVEHQLQAVTVVDIRAHNEDIMGFLQSRMPKIRCITARPDLQSLVKTEIVNAADGM